MIGRSPASFRDPSGFVFRRGTTIYRQVSPGYREHYEMLLASGLYDELAADGLLVPHEEVGLDLAASDSAYRVLKPAQLEFISYPYEWCFSQLRDAALATLRIQRRALARGMLLKDASAYNLQLHGGRTVLIDTLSFEPYVEGRPWIAYRQFCQHFLAPLALMGLTDVRLGQLLRIHLDGVPLDLAARLLPWSTRLRFDLAVHIHLHARSQRKHQDSGCARTAGIGRNGFTQRAFLAMVDHLESAVQRLAWRNGKTEWSDYYDANHNYGAQGLDEKERVVRNLVEGLALGMVWDLGANRGNFSRLAASCGARQVVAWDIDPACVESNYQRVTSLGEANLFPLLLDLTNPTPGVGWAGAERTSFAERGPADLILALGLVHHLAISNHVPLARVAAYLHSLGKRLVIEWIPKEDSQVQRLLASREDIFAEYNQASFERAFSQHFRIDRREAISGTRRSVYRMEGR